MLLVDWLTSIRFRLGFFARKRRRIRSLARRVKSRILADSSASIRSLESLEERILLTAPVAADDFYFVEPSTPLTVPSNGVLGNDTDADQDPLSATLVNGPANGTLTLNADGSFTYTPNAGFAGTNSFTYRASDGTQVSAVAVVTLDVGDVAGDSLSTARTVTLASSGSVKLGGRIGDGSYGSKDVDLFRVTLNAGEALIIDVDAAQLDNGTSLSSLNSYLRVFDQNGSQVAFNNDGTDPQTGQSSTDSILTFTPTMSGTYTIGVSGAGNQSYYPQTPGMGSPGSTGKYELYLTRNSNNPPELSNTSYTFTIPADATYGHVVGTVSATDPENDPVSYSSGSAYPFQVDSQTGQIRFMNSGGLTPGSSYNFTVTASANGGSDSASVTINVVAPNNSPPEFSSASYTFSVEADVAYGEVVGTLSAIDAENNPLSYSSNYAYPFQVDSQSGQVRYMGSSSLTVGSTYNFTATVSDAYGSDSASVTINVVSPNLPPVANSDTATTAYLTPVTINVLANDSDPEEGALALVSVSTPSNGTAVIENGLVIFTPTAGFAGEATFTYVVRDPENQTTTGNVTVTVTNQAPVAVDDDDAVTDTLTPITIDVLDNDSDPENSPLTLVSVTQPTYGSVAIENGEVVYTPDGAYLGQDTFTYTIEDAAGASATGTVTVTIAPLELTANDDEADVSQDVTVTLDVLDNDQIPLNTQLTISVQTPATHGTVVVQGLELVYTPNAGYVGADSFVYRLTDQNGTVSTATVDLTVFINESPVAADDEWDIEAGSGVMLDVLANDLDPEDGPLTILEATSLWLGTVTIVSGTEGEPDRLRYDSPADTYGIDTVTYVMADEWGRTATATVTLWITPRAVPVLNGLGLWVDTGEILDFVTTDPRVTGTVTSPIEDASLAVEIDYDGDQEADAVASVNRYNHTFLYDLAPDVVFGPVTVHVRAVELNGQGTIIASSDWQKLEFTYVEEDAGPDPPDQGDSGAAEFLNASVAVSTVEMVRVVGSVNDLNGGTAAVVEFDFNHDGIVDAEATTNNGEFLKEFTTEVGYGPEVVLRLRTRDIDEGTSTILHGAWLPLGFSRDYPDNDPPLITQLGLANDTDTPADGITSDATLSGSVSHADGALDGNILEYDFTGDGAPDGFVTTSAAGQFTIDLNEVGFEDGSVSVKVRSREWDEARKENLYGEWSTFTFEYTGNAAERPKLSGLELANDTETAGDLVTTDPRIAGTWISGLADLTQKGVEIDWDGDGQADDRRFGVDPATGEFVLDLASELTRSGRVTVDLRAWGFEAEGGRSLAGEWVEFIFTYEAPPPAKAIVTDLALVNDTGTVGDGITSDPRIKGTVTHVSESVSQAAVQVDWDGDGAYDAEVTSDWRGRFTLDLTEASLALGAQSILVRAGVWSSVELGNIWGDWEEFNFTLEAAAPPPRPEVTGLELLDDADGDGTVSRATLSGTVTFGEASVRLLPVQFDVDGDNQSDGQIYTDITGQGEFLIDLTPYLQGNGSKTVRFRAGDADGESFGDWTTFTFTYQAAASEEPEELVDENEVPFTSEELEHVEFESGNLAIGISAGNTNSTTAGSFSASYVNQGAIVGTSNLLASIANSNINENNPTNTTNTTTDGEGNTTEVTETGGYEETVTAYTDSSTGEWYRHENVVTTYDIITVYTGADGVSYEFHQWGTYGYTLTAYGYHGNSVYNLVEYRTDNYINEQSSASNPGEVYTITGSQAYEVESGGYVKVNDDGLAAPGSSAFWVTLVNTVNPSIDGTLTYQGAGYGRMEYSEYDSEGSVDHNGDFSDSWDHWYFTQEVTPQGQGTTTYEEFDYLSVHFDPYNITNSVNTNTTTTVNGVTQTMVINESTNLTGSMTTTFASFGTRTTYPNGTYESVVTQTTTQELHDVYTQNGTRTFSMTDNSDPNATVTQTSNSTVNATRNRDGVQTYGATTTTFVDGTQIVAGTATGNSNSNYNYTTSATMNSNGNYDDGSTVMSFVATSSSNSSGNGTFVTTTGGTFGTAGTNITNTYNSTETGSSDWDYAANSSRTTSHDDGAGNSSSSGGTGSSTNEGSLTYTNTLSVNEKVTNAGVTSTGTMNHTGSGNGSSSYDQTDYSTSNTKSDTPGHYSTSFNSSTSYSNGSSTWNTSSSGNGTITNGEADYTQTETTTGDGFFASGNTNVFTSYTESDDGYRFESHDSSGNSKYDESGTFNSSDTNTTNTSPSGSSSSSSSTYGKEGTTSWSSKSKSETTVFEDYSSPAYPGSGTYISWHDESHSSSSEDSGTGEYSLSSGENSTSGTTGPGSYSSTFSYSSSGSGTTISNGTSTITDYSHSDNDGVTSTSDSTSTVTTNSTTDYESEAGGTANTTNGVSTSLDSASSMSDTTSTVNTKTDRTSDSEDANNSDKITSNSHSESHATSDSTTTSHAESGSLNQLFANGTKATESTSSSTSNSTETFSSNSSGNSQRNVNGLNGVTSESTRTQSSDSSGDSTSSSASASSHITYADGTWSSASSSSGNSTVNTKSNSSSTSDFDSTDTSTAITKTVNSHASQATKNAEETVTSGWSSSSTGGSSGGTSEGWDEETVTGSGDVESESNATVRGEKDADNFDQKYNEQSKNGSYTLNGSSRSDRFADGKTSSSSSTIRTENGTSDRKEETTAKSKTVSSPQPGLTQTVTSSLTDTTNWTGITYSDSETFTSEDPVDGPYTSTETSSHSESGKQNWDYTSTSGHTLKGTVNKPGDDADGATFDASSSSTTTDIGNGDYTDSHSTTVSVTAETIGRDETVTGSGSSSLKGNGTLTTTENGSSTITQNTTVDGTTVNFSQTSTSKGNSTVNTKIDDSSSYETDGEGGTKSTAKSSPDMSGNSSSSSTKTTTVTLSKSGYKFTKIEKDIEKSSGNFKADVSHTIETDFDGTVTHSGGGSSDTKSQSTTEHYLDTTTTEKKTALISTWSGYYYQLETNDREDITKKKSDGNASLTFESDGSETWGGTQTDQQDINRDYKKTTIKIDSVSKGVTDRDNDGFQENYTKISGSKTEQHTLEANRSKTKHTIQEDGSLDAGEDVLGAGTKAAEIEKHEKAGNTILEKWEEKSSPSSGETVTEKWSLENSTDGTDKGYIYWSKGANDFYREYFDKSGVTETTSTYEFDKDVNNSTTKSTESIDSTSTSSYGMSQSKIVTPAATPGPPNTETWTKRFSESKSEFHHASDGSSEYEGDFEASHYGVTFQLHSKSKSSWDWKFDRVEKSTSSESQKREAGSDTATAKVDYTWELQVDYTGTWDSESHITTTSASDGGSTLKADTTRHSETTIDGDGSVTYSAQYDISGLNDEDNPPVVTKVGNPQPVKTWTWSDEWSGSATSTASATIAHYMPIYGWDQANNTMVLLGWQSKSFSGFQSYSPGSKFTASDSDPDGQTTDTSTPGVSDMEDADFLSAYIMPYVMPPGGYNGPGGSTNYDSFVSQVNMATMPATMSYSFQLFDALQDPSWIEQLAITVSDAFQQNFPELASFLSSTWEYASFFAADIFRQFDDGTMADRAFGLIDGFLNGINPFDHWISIPDIGPVYGHVEDYAFAKTVGTFAGIATGIAISFMGPGLVQCGTLAHKALVAWEAAGAIGGIGGSVTNIINNGGQVGVMDVLGIVGGLASIGGLKGLMNKCFVGDTLVVYGKEEVFLASTSDEQTAGPQNLVALILGGGLLAGAGAGWFLARRPRAIGATGTPPKRRKKHVLSLFGDADFLDHLWLAPGAKRPLPMLALADTGAAIEPAFEPPSSTLCRIAPLSKEPPMPNVAQQKQSLWTSRGFGWLLMLVCLLGSGLCFWQVPSLWFAGGSSDVLQAAPETIPPTKLLTRKIEDIQPGMRVLAENPELAGQSLSHLEIDPYDWRLVTLELAKPDGSTLTVELLRSRSEIVGASIPIVKAEPIDLSDLAEFAFYVQPALEPPVRLCQTAMALPGLLKEFANASDHLKHGLPLIDEDQQLVGRSLHLDQPELGAVGWATITRVAECPPIESGTGRIVTGRYIHQAANVIDLRVGGVAEPIGTTDTHPFWSEDRQEFVPAGELRIGETLLLANGQTTGVRSLTLRAGLHLVYNLEVDGEHVYYVSENGVLVHNGCTPTQYADDVVGKARGAREIPYTAAVSGRSRIADGVRGATAYEAKFVKGKWRNSAYNPQNIGKFSAADNAANHLRSQLIDYAQSFRQVVYYSNSKALLQLVRRIAKAEGLTNVVTRYRP